MIHLLRRTRNELRERWRVFRVNRWLTRVELDPRIAYPCYKSFDEFIDVERLKALNGYIEEFIQARSSTARDEKFNTGTLTLELMGKKKPGSRIIYLTHSTRPYEYSDLDRAGLWERTPDAAALPQLMDFIDTLPFKTTARMMIMYDTTGGAVTAHRDHAAPRNCNEFVWFRTNLRKPFFVLDQKTGKRKYVESYSAWFDTVNQFHGADAVDGLSFSIRVDGRWNDEFRRRIPTPRRNAASTPALWACTSSP